MRLGSCYVTYFLAVVNFYFTWEKIIYFSIASIFHCSPFFSPPSFTIISFNVHDMVSVSDHALLDHYLENLGFLQST